MPEYRYELDAEDRIRWVDRDWLRFADENEAKDLRPERVLGRPVFDFLSGGPVRHVYAILFQAARSGRTLCVPFRCDAPDRRRYMELRIEPADAGGLHLAARLLREERRPPVALLEAERPRGGGMVTICSWCKRIRTAPDVWEEVEDGIRRLGLFQEATLADLTHGICDACEQRVFRVATGPDDDAGDGTAA
ncbi:MAG: hypothetical protein R3263_00995 [Myxococcota bacterium]|nr:hypothetical protein [Myxococcota bacterium]